MIKELNENNDLASLHLGSQKAFKELFDQFFNPLCAFGSNYVGSREIIEDLVQEVFLGFFEQRQNFDQLQAVKSFLYTSTKNKCLNYLKHLKVRDKNQAALIYELESEHSFSSRLIEEEAFRQLYVEIRELPAASQKIMLLVLNGLANKEIATQLGISENTVKTQKKIAYSKLRTKVNPFFLTLFLGL